ncbi:MAG: UDP-N-acetylmuramoyl-tripeptide--D-alanyl-D-alanine ligase [Planctomycetota bacterium]|nr:UDP-N-acetylmuramoyl-tripeptide--D-alanyl-D-alanine ligase [Planctomycetota bacterium]
MLRWLLSAVGPTLASVKSYNNHIGVPITLLDIRPYHKFAIVELGASAAGEITPLARAVSPDVAVVTNVGTAHLEKFGSVRKIAETKAEIVKAVRPNGFVVLNGDDRSYPLFLENAKTKTITYAVDSSHADIQPTEVVMQTSSIHFDIFGTSTKLPMGGKHNLYNALAALTVIDGLGLDSARSANRLRGFTPPPMRGNIFYVGPVVIVNDAFNCNPSSLKASLEYFEHIPAPNKVFVLGDMLELGKESEKYHREAGKALADSSAEVFVAFGDEAANSYAEFRSNSEKDAMHLPKGSHRKVADYLVPLVENGAVVFFKGSRKLKLERAVSELIRGLKNHYLRERAELED